MQNRQPTPLIIRGLDNQNLNGEVAELQPVLYVDRKLHEAWLQKLLFNHPALLPIGEIEAVFGNPTPICTELPVGGGAAADLLFINRNGYITLVETKLLQNPESRQEVVAQIIRYASEMSHWSYSDLCGAVRKRVHVDADPILEVLHKTEGEFQEESFVEQVSQNLNAGKFLLLIVGDGVRPEVEKITDYLRRFPTLGFTLGLIKIALFREPGRPDAIIAQPILLGRTEVVERTIVEVKVPVGASTVVTVESGSKGRRQSITEEEYYKILQSAAGRDVAGFVRGILAGASGHGLRVHWMEGGPTLKYDYEPKDTFFNFGTLHKAGYLVERGDLFLRCKQLGLPLEICRNYLDEIARLVPGAQRRLVSEGKAFETEKLLFGKDPGFEDYVPLDKFIPVKDQWMAAIDKAIQGIQACLEGQ